MKYALIISIIALAVLIVLLIANEIRTVNEYLQTEPTIPELVCTEAFDVPMPKEHQEIVRYWCKQLDVSERLVYGVIFAESGFNNEAVNERTGCFGYMQLNPAVFDKSRFSDPKANLTAGIMELARLKCIYGDIRTVLLCYNNGETGAARLIADGVTETDYTRKVLGYADEIKSVRIYEEDKR